jgi:hypothetical protein
MPPALDLDAVDRPQSSTSHAPPDRRFRSVGGAHDFLRCSLACGHVAKCEIPSALTGIRFRNAVVIHQIGDLHVEQNFSGVPAGIS